jgi:response regulator RpfG family c-di-GMP phosphodiesterase
MAVHLVNSGRPTPGRRQFMQHRPSDDTDRRARGAQMAAQTTKLKLLLAEDHVLVREGLKRLIDDQPDMVVIAEAEDGIRAVRVAQDVMPDVAVVDLSMPGLDGVQVTQ